VWRNYRWRELWLRGRHEIRRRASGFQLRPRHQLVDCPAPPPGFTVDRDRLSRSTDLVAALERAELAGGGRYQAYRASWLPLPRGAAWHRGPAGLDTRADLPWWAVDLWIPERGDLKDLWEPSRFGWVYDLVRGYLLTGDESLIRAFAATVEDWAASNPPFFGVGWACGQEAAIRATALRFAEANFGDSEAFRGVRELVAALLLATGERIADAIGGALSQRNNHGISEALGLLLVGERFSDHLPVARDWFERGERLLARQIIDQFAPDGWYIQHSFGYARLALEQCVLGAYLLRLRGRSLPAKAERRLVSAIRLLGEAIDGDTGLLPNHGASDGSDVLPISVSGYRDFRPVLSVAAAMFGVPLPSDIPPDGEPLAWLGLTETPRTSRADGLVVGPSGWAVIRRGPFRVFLRAGRYASRPGHADALHVDVSWGTREILVDPGTYRYAAPAPWTNALADASVHNGPVVGTASAVRGSRFLWLSRPHAAIVSQTRTTEADEVVAEIPGAVRRTVRLDDRGITVRDQFLTLQPTDGRVTWLLGPEAGGIPVVARGDSVRRARGTEAASWGWFSPHYGDRVSCEYLQVSSTGQRGSIMSELDIRPGTDLR
jgi:hypothetical protein